MPWWGWLLLTVFVFIPILYFLVVVILAVALDIDVHNILKGGYCCAHHPSGACECIARGKGGECASGYQYSPTDTCQG